NILNSTTSPEGYKLLHLISSYLQLDSYISLDIHTASTLAAIEAELLVFDNVLKVNIDFPKMHLWKHTTRAIQIKGAVCNFSTNPNEKLHGPLKEAYEHQSNGKNVANQVCF
ncbi:hypothetical protein EV424DRAFT_1326824, partial [Suillus variegatus]